MARRTVDRTGLIARFDRPAFLSAAFFGFLIVWSGVPALRHDWAWPARWADVPGWFLVATSGWSPFGVGAPAQHIESYLLAAPIAVVAFALGPRIALGLFAFAIAYALAATGAWFARRVAQADGLTAATTGAFLLFNPWTYTEVVAGHLGMVLALAGLAGMLVPLCSKARAGDARATALFAVLAYSQLQFYLIALALAAAFLTIRRNVVPLLTALIVGAPAIAGIVGNYGTLEGTPAFVAWQRDQSIDIAFAWRLIGYFAGYAADFDVSGWAIVPVCLAACVGLWIERSRPWARGVAVAAVCALLAVLGLRGPLAAPYGWLIEHWAPVGVVRELYDLAGVLALCYAALACVGAARVAWLRAGLTLAAVVFAGTWLFASPWRWWVPAERLPAVAIDVPAGARYALLPAFQPLSLRDGSLGAGEDPDARYLLDGAAAINEYEPSYPADAALARYEMTGAARDLAALGVAAVYVRPWLRATSGATARYDGDVAGSLVGTSGATHVGRAAPLVSLLPLPGIDLTGTHIGAGNVFFGDAATALDTAWPSAWRAFGRVGAVRPPKIEANPALDWVDARLLFLAFPDLAQPFGGAATTSTRLLPLETGARHVLANVDGYLDDDRGRPVVATSTGGYRWLALPPGARGVRCAGRCVVALTGDPPVGVAVAGTRAGRPVEAARVLPWLAGAVLPPLGASAVVRLNERFDAHWVAIQGWAALPHVRLDATVNGWLVPPGNARRVYFVDVQAAIQAALEAAGVAWTLALLVRRRPVIY